MKSMGKAGNAGKGTKSMAHLAKRPPKVKGRVANDLWPNPVRSAAGPPPQCDSKGSGVKRK
jgi:hypothetical protein